MNLQQIKVSVERIEKIDAFLPKVIAAIEYLSKPGNNRATLDANGTRVMVSHEFATMLYTAERDRLVHERTSLAAALKLDEVQS